MVDNPVYLSDLGAVLTGAEPAELQAVLEEMDVSTYLNHVFIHRHADAVVGGCSVLGSMADLLYSYQYFKNKIFMIL